MVDRYVKLYTELSKVPNPVNAWCRSLKNNCSEIVSVWEQRDLLRMEKVTFQRSIVVDSTSLKPIAFNVASELNNEQKRAYSSDGCLTAVLRKLTDKQGSAKQYIEIWKGNTKIKSIDALAQEKHLHIYSDPHFGSFHWSPTNSHLLYTAETFFKAESFFKVDSKDDKKQGETSGEDFKKAKTSKGDEFLYRQSWGEQLTNVQFPLVFTLDLENERIEAIPALPLNVSCSEAVWTPDGRGVVFVGLLHEPYKLGSIFCANRESSIYYVDLANKTCSTVSDPNSSVSFPRFSPDGKYLVYLQSPVGGPHRTVQALIRCDWSSKSVKSVVDYVDAPGEDGFPGIYTLSLPERIWSEDSKRVFLNSHWRSRQDIISVDVETGERSRVTGNDVGSGGWTLLDVADDALLVAHSSFNLRSRLMIFRAVVDGMGRTANIRQNFIDLEEEAVKPLLIDYRTLNLKPTPESINPKFPKVDYDALLIHPSDRGENNDRRFPLIVYPHGGPHSVFSIGYALSVEYFTSLGFAILFVNYRGSIGFGGDNVNSLLGNVGTQDVLDCQHAVETANETGLVDRNRMVLCGGSHGGFLVLCLSGQYPDTYRACIARNPVVNIADMVVLSDIPDWSFTECGFDFRFDSMTTPEQSAAMRQRSPIHWVDKMKTPTLLMLGSQDLRVPLRQGLYLHHALKARNVETKVFVYDDVHGLSKVQSESDGIVHMADWMVSNIQ